MLLTRVPERFVTGAAGTAIVTLVALVCVGCVLSSPRPQLRCRSFEECDQLYRLQGEERFRFRDDR